MISRSSAIDVASISRKLPTLAALRNGDEANIRADTIAKIGGRLEQAVDRDTEHAERALIFRAFRAFLDLLQGHLGGVEESFIVHELAAAALPLVNLLQ